jgi:hypothetical protein
MYRALPPFPIYLHEVVLKHRDKFTEVLSVVKMLTEVFWVVTMCTLVGGYHHF